MLGLIKTLLIAAAMLVVVNVKADEPAKAAHDAPPTEAETLSTSFRKTARLVLPTVVTVRPLGLRPAVDLGFLEGEGLNATGVDLPRPPSILPRRPIHFTPPDVAEVEAESGSGVIIDAAKGYVLTNDHVIDGARGAVVVLHNGRERTVSKILRDPRADLALLVIEPKGLQQAEWGDSESLETGDWVLAVGQPFGLSGTVTSGIVSAKGRAAGLIPYDDLIQTDAAINPGNSGGPLVDLKGRIVGINIALRTVRGGFEGVGLAIPASRARRVANDLAAFGGVKRGYLGVSIGPVDRETAERLDQPGAILVNGVSVGSPAAEARILVGDVILAIEGKRLKGVKSLQSLVEFADRDKPLHLTIARRGVEPTEVVVKLAERVAEQRTVIEPPPPDRLGPKTATIAELGLTVAEPTRDLAKKFALRNPVLGLVVVEVEANRPAARAGIQPGMVIFELDRVVTIRTVKDFQRSISDRAGRESVLLGVYLRGLPTNEINVELRAAEAPPPNPAPPGEAPKPVKLPDDDKNDSNPTRPAL